MSGIEKVCAFLEECGTYYLATVDGDQPRVRPFGTVLVYEGKLYIQTGKAKPVSRQLAANPKAEICAFSWKSILPCGQCTTRRTIIRRCCISAMVKLSLPPSLPRLKRSPSDGLPRNLTSCTKTRRF